MKHHRTKLKLSLSKARFLYRMARRLGNFVFDLDALTIKVDTRIYEYSFVLHKLAHLPKGRVLDVGCSSGQNFIAPALAALGWEVCGLDRAKLLLECPHWHFVLGEATRLPFSDQSFDAVYAVSTLEHIGPGGEGGRYGLAEADADFQVVAEISRVLKPGGSFLVTVPFGRPRVIKGAARIYDKARLGQLFRDSLLMKDRRAFFRDAAGWGRLVALDDLDPQADFDLNDATALLEVRPGD